MAGESLHVSFYTTVTVVQALLAGFLIVRRPRSEHARILGLLFAFNAAVSASFATMWLHAGDPVVKTVHDRVYHYFDPPTSLLVAYFALIYPRPPKILQDHPWKRTLIWLLPLTAWWAYLGVNPDLNPGITGMVDTSFFAIVVVPAIGWIAILARVIATGPRLRDALRDRTITLVLGAFAIRAANIGTYDTLNTFLSGGVIGGLAADIRAGLLLLQAATVIVAILVVLQARKRIPHARRDAIDLLLLFLVLGIIEALWTLGERIGERASHLFSVFDLYVVRPALIWTAIVKHDFLTTRLRSPAVTLGLLAVLGAAGFGYALREETFGIGASPLPLPLVRLLTALIASGILVLVLRPFLAMDHRGPVPTGHSGPDPEDVQSYLERLDYAVSRGGPHADDPRLGALRTELRITPRLDDRLRHMLTTDEAPQRSAPWVPGEVVADRYRIIRYLGEGGSSELHQANDLTAGGTVVLKRTHDLTHQARTLLLNEATHADRLGHRHILPVLRVEKVEDEPVLVFPYADGGSLKGRIGSTGPIAPDEALRMLLPILDALAAAHDAGIVHADVKPSNILLGTGGPWLADFGVARPVTTPDRLGDPTATTPTGGTLLYMAPEQVRGAPATPQSDLYAFAATLYETLEGHTWIDDTCADFETRERIVKGTGRGMSDRIPPPLRAVLERALAPSTRKRHPSASALRNDLEGIIGSI